MVSTHSGRRRMAVTLADIEQAAARLEGLAVRTPVVESAKLNERVGGRVLIKAECLQRTGSFKFRGAWNAISQLDAAAAKGGVVTYSSGNHAQGVAAAAQLKGLPAAIVMPADTPAIKIASTKAYGAEVVTYDRATESREAIAMTLAERRGAAIIPPFEHEHVIAGQGTIGLEFAAQAKQLGATLDDVLVPCSGGGLAAGIALAFAARSPATRVHTVEPAGFDDMARSLVSGKRERNAAATGSICDALLSPGPGELTFAINRGLLGEGYAVSDGEAAAAMRYAFEVLKLVIEPGGAVALAAVLAERLPVAGRTIGIIASGGNVDAGLYAKIIEGRF
ncbi:MAG: threonine/serine dehydratase [Rhizobiales bacterium]|nr:threonine/serine dehydratase [Hyphomicrobiales bacterium]